MSSMLMAVDASEPDRGSLGSASSATLIRVALMAMNLAISLRYSGSNLESISVLTACSCCGSGSVSGTKYA